jgi:hypothetical protein
MEGIYNQITALRATSFVEPDAIVIHPTDWQTIRLGKDSQNQYYAGGPFTGAYGNPGPSNVSTPCGASRRSSPRPSLRAPSWSAASRSAPRCSVARA